jgi:uncharacterized membrane protein YfcA
MLLAALLFVLVGLALGLLGGGGSVLALPILVYVVGLETRSAIATSLLVVGTTSAVAAVSHARAMRVDFRVGAAFAACSMASAYVGARLARFVPAAVLLAGFGLMMLVTGIAMLRGRVEHAHVEGPRRWARIAAAGVAIGSVTGLVGAGGGFVIVPALALLCRLPMANAIGTSVLVIAASAFAAFAGHAGEVPIHASVAAVVTVAAAIGSLVGSRLAGRARPETLRRTFGWFVLAMAVVVLAKQIAHEPTGVDVTPPAGRS